MNANEVIAALVMRTGRGRIHPNDDVNLGQSSNDVIPTALRVGAHLAVSEDLLPALRHLRRTIDRRARDARDLVKTGRTHLMDAMPMTFGQELGAWSSQLDSARMRIEDSLKRLRRLPIGGTAVGTGINTDPSFGKRVAQTVSVLSGVRFVVADDKFEGIAAQDDAVELSGQLSVLAVALMKIANDLRWMNSGPLAGLGEIELPALQPGSSIMPGKVNPVIPEAVAMVCAQVMGHHTAVTVAGQSGNFQLNVMLPLIAANLLDSIGLLANAMNAMADSAIAGMIFRADRIAKKAYRERRAVLDVALEDSGLDAKTLKRLLDPAALVKGGVQTGSGGG
jgi:fumarate hydratase class II